MIARQYRGRVPVISVNVWEKEKQDAERVSEVTQFVKDRGDGMDYTVVTDDGQQTIGNAWLKASGSAALPVAFIVHDRHIAWMGHPVFLEEPLAQVVAGAFDVRAAKKKYDQDADDMAEWWRLSDYAPLAAAVKSKDFSTQIRIYEQAVSMNPRLRAGSMS